MENRTDPHSRRDRRLRIILPAALVLWIVSTLLYFTTLDEFYVGLSGAALFWIVLPAILLRRRSSAA